MYGRHNFAALLGRLGCTAGVATILLIAPQASWGVQKHARAKSNTSPQTESTDQLAKLRAEYVAATRDYKASLQKLLALYESSLPKAEQRSTQAKALFAEGLISKSELEESGRALAVAREKVSAVKQQIGNADIQIANALVEADAEAKIAKSANLPRGALVRTTSYIRFNGPSNWGLSDAWKVQRFFQDTFKKQLPVAVFGQGSIHDRWHLDHRNAMDVSVNPDGSEGQTLMTFLRNNGIPFSAFREAIPGTATGPHIHIGKPSHRY